MIMVIGKKWKMFINFTLSNIYISLKIIEHTHRLSSSWSWTLSLFICLFCLSHVKNLKSWTWKFILTQSRCIELITINNPVNICNGWWCKISHHSFVVVAVPNLYKWTAIVVKLQLQKKSTKHIMITQKQQQQLVDIEHCLCVLLVLLSKGAWIYEISRFSSFSSYQKIVIR